MKRLMSLALAAIVGVSALTLTACDSSDRLPLDERGATAGGNGMFGEDPVQPGAYDTTNAPTTRPSSAVSR